MVCVLAGATGGLVILFSQPPVPATLHRIPTNPAFDRLAYRMERTLQQLEQLLPRDREPERSSGEQSVSDPESRHGSSERLRSGATAETKRLTSPDSGTIAELAQTNQNGKALELLRQQHVRDARGASRTHRLLGYREVLERFGGPTSVYGEDGGVVFLYTYGDHAEHAVELSFTFCDGLVVEVDSYSP
jgi:hypothetical protein